MSWIEDNGFGRMYDVDDSDVPVYQNSSLEMEAKSPLDIIDLTAYSPVSVPMWPDEASCNNDVLLVFPDICPDYLAQLGLQHNYKSDAVISAILDKQEKEEHYPTQATSAPRPLKRKRTGGSDEPEHDPDHDDYDSGSGDEQDPESVRSIKLKIATNEYLATTSSHEYAGLARTLLSQEFPRVPRNAIRNLLLANHNSLFETYTVMDEALRNRNDADVPWRDKKTATKISKDFTPDGLPSLDISTYKAGEQAAIAEFVAARELRAMKDAKIAAEVEEKNNFRRAKDEGQTSDCGICYDEYPLNRMVRCEGETMHWFCRNCLRCQAETQIGMAKYELTCMSLDGCSARFSHAQRALFLNKKLTIALDRIEQEAVLRMAGIENLETCPVCPYAAEYPPVEVDKEFRCENPRCQQVSCRLCRRTTHIPKTCAEADADRGLDARHILEEAMSEALIRRCNSCQNPFVKQDGCNKIRCTKCGTLQCDVCRKTIKDYTHFNDLKRGGKTGHCPLFDESEGRHKKEVSGAEAETRKRMIAENPGVNEEMLRISAHQDNPGDANTRKTEVPAGYQPPLNHLDRHRHEAAINVNAGRPYFRFRGLNELQVPRAMEDQAQKNPRRIEYPVPLRIANVGAPDATPIPAPGRQNIGRIINKIENFRKMINVDARRRDEEVKSHNNIALLNPPPAMAQGSSSRHQNISQIAHAHIRAAQAQARAEAQKRSQATVQATVDPAQLQLGFNGLHLPQFPGAPRSFNVGAPLMHPNFHDTPSVGSSHVASPFQQFFVAGTSRPSQGTGGHASYRNPPFP